MVATPANIRFSGRRFAPPLNRSVEAVEKVPKQNLGRDAERSELIECATINDLILGKGQMTPENIVLTRQKAFSTGSLAPRERRRAWA